MSTLTTASRHCPRCGLPLLEKPLGRRWLRFFECSECWMTFELVTEKRFERCVPQSVGVKFLRHITTLQPGRTPIRRNR